MSKEIMPATTIKVRKNRVSFGMYWQCYGRQEIVLPDDIDPKDRDAVLDYIRSQWDQIPIPGDGEYVSCSDELDDETLLEIYPSEEDVNCMLQEEGNLRVEWVNDGEGICGDYNPDDPEDVNLLRFDVSILRGRQYEEVEDASYCTQMPADTDPKVLLKALRYLLKEYSVLQNDPDVSVKKLGEQLSWMCPEWFVITPEMIREGLKLELVKFISDPNNMLDPGTVCQIGETWFYFGGPLAAELSPDEYVKAVDEDDIISMIIDALEELESNGEEDEYHYCRMYLNENIRKAAHTREN